MSKYKHGNDINEHKSKTNESHKRSSNKQVVLHNLPVYYSWKNIRQQYKIPKVKITTPTWSYEFELPDGSYSVSDIQDYIKFIIKKHDTPTNPPIHIYINRINNRLVFKIEDDYKLKLKTSETIKSSAVQKI